MRDLISFDQLAEVMSSLHDCPFDLDRASFSEETQKWTGTFFRPLWDDPAAEHAGWALVYSRSRLPAAEAFVTVANVAVTNVLDDQGIGRYSFNQVERTPNGIRLCFNEASGSNFDWLAQSTRPMKSGHRPGCKRSTVNSCWCRLSLGSRRSLRLMRCELHKREEH
jgi:hypothetical protein